MNLDLIKKWVPRKEIKGFLSGQSALLTFRLNLASHVCLAAAWSSAPSPLWIARRCHYITDHYSDSTNGSPSINIKSTAAEGGRVTSPAKKNQLLLPRLNYTERVCAVWGASRKSTQEKVVWETSEIFCVFSVWLQRRKYTEGKKASNEVNEWTREWALEGSAWNSPQSRSWGQVSKSEANAQHRWVTREGGRTERGLTLIKLSARSAGRGSITQAKTLH